MVKISTVIQIIFAEKFISQDFSIRAAPGLSGPTNTCERTSNLHFAEEVKFAYRWSCIGKGLQLEPAQQVCFILLLYNLIYSCTQK